MTDEQPRMYRRHTRRGSLSTLMEGGWMICNFSIVQVHFEFCLLNFIILFSFLERLRRLFFLPDLFFRIFTPLFLPFLLFLCLISFLLFPCARVWNNTRALVTHFLSWYDWEGWMFFNSSIVLAHFLLLIEFHCSFSISNKILTNYVCYNCILIRIV